MKSKIGIKIEKIGSKKKIRVTNKKLLEIFLRTNELLENVGLHILNVPLFNKNSPGQKIKLDFVDKQNSLSYRIQHVLTQILCLEYKEAKKMHNKIYSLCTENLEASIKFNIRRNK